MVIRRTAAPTAPRPIAPAPPRAQPNRPQPRAASSFQAARAAPLALDGNVQRPFVRPAQGEWTVDQHSGQRSDPVTIYVHGSLDQVETALGATGWTQADPKSLSANLHYLGAAAKDEAYQALAFIAKRVDGLEIGLGGVFGKHLHPWLQEKAKYVPAVNRMPVSMQSYRGQPLVAAFERNNNPLGGRDHLRVFATGEVDAQGKPVYAIAASHDAGIRFAPDHPECAFLFHTVTPDVSAERDAVLSSLRQAWPASQLTSFAVPFGGRSKIGEYVGDSKGYELSL